MCENRQHLCENRQMGYEGCGKKEKMAHSFPRTALACTLPLGDSRKLDLLLPRPGTACLRDPARRITMPHGGTLAAGQERK